VDCILLAQDRDQWRDLLTTGTTRVYLVSLSSIFVFLHPSDTV
jgi:hypothetical protein